MSLHEFMRAYETAKVANPGELAAMRIPNPRLRYYTFFALLEGLRADWRSGDPGKFQPNYFFVRDFATEAPRFGGARQELAWCDRMYVADVVDDLAAAKVGIKEWCGFPQVRPRPAPLGSFADVRREPCTDCGHPGLVVGKYDQIRNGIEYDEWEIAVSVLCLACAKVPKPLHRRSECRRIYDLLSRPS